jgi:transposase-like protein
VGTELSKGLQLKAALVSHVWHEREARVVVAAWEASGESLGAFARRHGLGESRLDHWRRRLRVQVANKVEEPGAEAFLPVKIVERLDDGLPEMRGGRGVAAAIEIVVRGGRVIRVPDGFDPSTLARVVQTLEALSC